jgi:thioredoxin-like negative regulator of GroEL
MSDATGGNERLETLREMVADDPADLLARLLLGRELLATGDTKGALEHLGLYVARFVGDKGAACGAYAEALHRVGRMDEARAAIAAGIENAKAHRHLGLVAQLEAQRDDL